MNTEYLEKYLELLADNQENVVVDALGLLTESDQDELDAFHAQAVEMIERNDERFLDTRANHFVVEIGWSERHMLQNGTYIEMFLVSANHKGSRNQMLIRGRHPIKIG